MSSADDMTNQSTQGANPSFDSETRSRQALRSFKDKKKRKTRSRVIKDEEENGPNDPDFSPQQELAERTGEISTCSTPIDENISSAIAILPNSGKICALCYCGEKSLLGQGELTRYDPTPGFNPFRKPTLKRGGRDSLSGQSPAAEHGERSSKSPSRSRNRETRNSRDSSVRNRDASMVYELSLIGCAEIADPSSVFETTGHVTAHHCCAAWSEGVIQNELYQLLHVDKAVHQGMSSKCSYCSRFGATIKCKASKCDRIYHYPCAAGSGCFQDIKAMLMLCPNHLEQAPSVGAPEELNCAVCDDIGEISDFLFCTSCGHHYHGNCLHVEVNPVVRAGWQCPDCKICQTCGLPGDDNQMLVCDSCDKGYHTYCLTPAIPCIPSNGWCCQNCRRCTDCGMKPKSGSSSVWNFSEEVCDKCFQRQDQGHSCPVCDKGYPEQLRNMEMMQCNACKKWVHEDCDDTVDLDSYNDMGNDYACPKCRDEIVEMETTADPPPSSPPLVSETNQPEEEDIAESMEVVKQPAKRSSISSSIESDKSSSGMKGSSTDPMLFAPQTSLSGSVDDKQRHTSDETTNITTQQARNPVERKVSSDNQLGSLFSSEQDPLSFFTNDAFQPIVSVPMLSESDDPSIHKLVGDDLVMTRDRKSSIRDLHMKSTHDSSSRLGSGKPGSIYGKGKPFGNKKKPPASRSSKGKGGVKEKSRSNRRQKQGSSTSNPTSNVSSPVNTSLLGQSNVVPTSMSIRRRSRSRLSRQDSSMGGGASDVTHEVVDEEFGDSMHNTVVLCSAEDTFTLNQDMCVVCGSFGQGKEGRLVACSQCGQCYHPYCVNLKLTKVVLRKGWRCLDCTVCEECGAADNPSHLLLCDDCDISYHTYCLKPPLLHVPKGGWKCKWCVRCTHCLSTSPGLNSDWAENYTACGPCASLAHCPICRRSYRDEEIIMQCSTCERWLHSACEYLYTESDIEKVLEKGFSCILCRPKGSIPPHLNLNPPNAFEGDPSSGIYLGRTRSDVEQVKEYHKDGVALTSAGLQHIQQLMQSAMGLNKKKPNVHKRKSSVQKQTDNLSSQIDVKPSCENLPGASITELDCKDVLKDEESLDSLPSSQIDASTSGDAALDSSTVSDTGMQSTPHDPTEPLPSPQEGGDPLISPSPSDLTKQVLSGVQDSVIKRRRKPYRPGIGGFMVRQRNRGGLVGTKGKRNRIFKAVPSLPTANFSTTTGFNCIPSKVDEVKLRASEITGEYESSYIKHETDGGITIAHQENQDSEMKDEESSETKLEGQSSMLVSPLKLKISALPPTQPKPKRKRRARLIDQFPTYIQEGFFGACILTQARTTKSNDVDLEESKKNERKPSRSYDSQIILPERVKLRLDAQVAMKAAEAKRNAELKEKLASRNTSNDDESLMIDKVSEDLLGVLPDDLPFKEDEILGMLSGTQDNEGGNGGHESILSPSALETLVTDGLASIDGDVSSLFTDVLNNAQDGDTDEHNLLRDIGNLTDPSKSSNSVDLLESSLPNTSHSTSASAFDIDSTNAIIDEISQDMLTDVSNIKQEQATLMQTTMSQPQHMHVQQHQQMQMQQQQRQQQQQQQQLNIQQMQQVPHNTFNMQPQMQSNMQMMNKHMFGGDLPVSDPSYINPQQQQQQQQQHSHFQVSLQQGPIQQASMHIDQSMTMQPQKFVQRHVQGVPGIPQNVPMSMAPSIHDSLHHHGMMQRQHSVDPTPGHVEMQAPPQKLVTSTGQVIYRQHHPQAMQKQQLPPQSPSVGQIPPSPGLIPKHDPNAAVIDQSGQVSVQNLPDLTREPTLFEPAAPPWPLCTDLDGDTLSVNQRNILKWEKDEPLGQYATISPVLYANLKHPYLKKEYPDWPTRAKQVAKLWRKATQEERAPFLQKARDNRAFSKSTKRDFADQDELDEEDRVNLIQQSPFNPSITLGGTGFVDSRLGPHVTGIEGVQQGSALTQPPTQVTLERNKLGSMSNSPDYNTFVKPKPPSRDPTPKPQSPGASPSSGNGGVRSKSPFSAKSPVGQAQGQGRATQQGYPVSQRPWNEMQMQGQAMQQPVMTGQQTWSTQQQAAMTQHNQAESRMPKMENIDPSVMMSSQGMRFPQQAFPGNQNVSAGLSSSLSGAPKPGSIQRQDSAHEVAMAPNQDQFIVRTVTPRPGIPPQLLPHVGHMPMGQQSVPQSPVEAHPALRSPTPKVSQGYVMGHQIGQRDTYQAVDKYLQRWPSVSSEPDLEMHAKMQSSMVPQSPAAVTSRALSVGDESSVGIPDTGDKVLNPPTPGGRPPIREMIIRRRYKLLEQQAFPGTSWVSPSGTVMTRPPPPYPAQSPVPSSQAFVFNSGVRAERYPGPQPSPSISSGDTKVRGPRPQTVPSSPNFNSSLVQSSFGVERLPGRTSSASSVTGVHPVAGQSPMSGYIELRHSKHADPAVRREQLIRAGAALPTSTQANENKPHVTSAAANSSIKSIVPKQEPITVEAFSAVPTATRSKDDSKQASQPDTPTTSTTDNKLTDSISVTEASSATSENITATTIITPSLTNTASDSTSLTPVSSTIVTPAIGDETKEKSNELDSAEKISSFAVASADSSLTDADQSKKVSEKSSIDSTQKIEQALVDKQSMSSESDITVKKSPEQASTETSEISVSAEHSYVKINDSGSDQAQSIDRTATVKLPSPVDSNEVNSRIGSLSSDGLIRGVGLTPPPDTTVLMNSPDDGVLVSNVVVVERDSNKEAKQDSSKQQKIQDESDKKKDDVVDVTIKPSSPSPKVVDEAAVKSELSSTEHCVKVEVPTSESSEINLTPTDAPATGVENLQENTEKADESFIGNTSVTPLQTSTTTDDVVNTKEPQANVSTETSSIHVSDSVTTKSDQVETNATSTSSALPPSTSSVSANSEPPASTSPLITPQSSTVSFTTSGVSPPSVVSTNTTSVPVSSPPSSSNTEHVTKENLLVSAASTIQSHPATNPPQPPAAQHPRPKPLLIKEQPLLLQDLLDQEKQELEKRKLEKMNLSQQSASLYPIVSDPTKREMGMDKIMQAKMKVLSGITQVIKGTASQPGVEGSSSSVPIAQRPGIGNWGHPQPPAPLSLQTPDSSLVNAQPSGTEGGSQQNVEYEKWLIQHQALLQMQLNSLDQLVKQHRSAKHALTKKQRQIKKNGEELTSADTRNLTLANKKVTDTQLQIDEIRKEQVHHSELIQKYLREQGQSFTNPASNQAALGSADMLPNVRQQFQQPPSISQPIMRQQQSTVLTQQTQASTVPTDPIFSQSLLPTTVSSQVSLSSSVPGLVGNEARIYQQQQQDVMVAQYQKPQPMRLSSQADLTQFVLQNPPTPNSSVATSLHISSEPSRPIASQGGPGYPPQMMLPLSVNVKQDSCERIETVPRGQFAPAQVSSVNVNTGSNMVTKGPVLKPVIPGSPASLSSINPVQAVSTPHIMPIQGQTSSLPQEKPKRKRKKPKSSAPENTANFDPRFVVSRGLVPSGVAGAVDPNKPFHFSLPPRSFMQVTRVMSSPSAVAMVNATSAFVTTNQPMLQSSPQISATLPGGLHSNMNALAPSSGTAVFYPSSLHQGSCAPGMKSPVNFIVAGHPVPVNSLKREMLSPQAKVSKTSHPPPRPPPPRLAPGLTDAEVEIICATDPDARSTPSTPSTPDSRSGASPFKLESAEVMKTEQVVKSPSLIDETIDKIIKDGLEYTEKVEMMKGTGGRVVPPHWMRIPKPTKFPSKQQTPQSLAKNPQSHFPGGFASPMFSSALATNHEELLRHMLKTGSDIPMQELPGGSIAMMSPVGPYGGLEKTEFEIDANGKKKRSRGGSKDKDGKEKAKKKKKRKRQSQDEEAVFLQDQQRLQGGAVKSAHKGFPTEQSPVKQSIQWKALPLLPLVEPDIKINMAMCMPKGTGLTQNKSLLEGILGQATLRGLPDYYDLLRSKDPFIYMQPPTPPSSLPPSPKRIDCLDGELVAHQHVKVPDSLPTPPHQIPDIADDFSTRTSADEVAPSSPELEDSKDPLSSNDFLMTRALSHVDVRNYQAPSPTIPFQLLPHKIEVEENDDVSVTISFKTENTKFIKKYLSRLSRTLGTSIVSFKLEDTKKNSKKENGSYDNETNKENKGFSGSSDHSNSTRRHCFHCDEIVVGNGVRKPLFGENLQEEDIIFCNKDCYFKNEFQVKVKIETSSVKKKWKASHVYQRHTRKIDISSLISANPDPEFVSTRGKAAGVTPSNSIDAADDGNKNGDGKGRGRGRRRGSTGPGEESKHGGKRWKGIKWKKWTVSIATGRTGNQKPPADVDALLSKYGSALKPPPELVDSRKCVLCGVCGDGETKGVARLLNLDVDQWVHLNCALWSAEVYETQGGALINVDLAVRNGVSATCVVCMRKGATIRCHRTRCINIYHCACALECGCHFYKDKTVLCPSHVLPVGSQTTTPLNHDQLKTLAVFRKVYVQRKETKQIASIMQQGELTQGEKNYILRVGALMFYAVGQLSTHQMTNFHSKTAIYPVGYKATRIYWSSNNTRKRCKYICMISDKDNKPWFTTRYQAVASRPKTAEKITVQGEWMEMSEDCVNSQWSDLLLQLAGLRNQQKMLKLFPAYINGENIFGLTSPVVCRILESLPNIEICANYKFRYGRSPILEVPLALNPTGSARSEPHIKHSRKKLSAYWIVKMWYEYRPVRQVRMRIIKADTSCCESKKRKGRPHTLISNLISEYYESTGVCDASTSLYGKHFVHSKSSQYRRMKQDWRSNVNLARSRIQGLGLFASRDIEPGTMVIEYIGQIIRSEVAEKREKKYEAANRGVYMFRLDSDYIVDATVTGGPARYINHSCNPNCVAEVVNFEKEKKIMIISNRLILSGEELNYDYKFDFEDDGNKIPCLCGSINCRKWMN